MSKFLFERKFAGGTSLTATDTASGYNVANINDYRKYSKWKAASSGTKYITVNHSGTQTADMIGIAGHNFGTASAEVTLEAELPLEGGGTGWVEIADLGTFTSNADTIKTFTQYTSDKYRLKIVTASVAAEIGVIFLGDALDTTYSPEIPYAIYNEEPIANSEFSKNGNLLGSVIEYHRKTINPVWRNLSTTFVTDDFLPAWETYMRGQLPFFFSWDPANSPEESYYCKIVGGSTLSMPRISSAVVESLSISLEAV